METCHGAFSRHMIPLGLEDACGQQASGHAQALQVAAACQDGIAMGTEEQEKRVQEIGSAPFTKECVVLINWVSPGIALLIDFAARICASSYATRTISTICLIGF